MIIGNQIIGAMSAVLAAQGNHGQLEASRATTWSHLTMRTVMCYRSSMAKQNPVLKIQATRVQEGDELFMAAANLPTHRPTDITKEGWYRVFKVIPAMVGYHKEIPLPDVVCFRLTNSPWGSDDIPFNRKTKVEIRRE